MKLLVHACCGPCSIMPTKLLAEEGHDIAVFYANSNIAPVAEYEHRLAELKRYAAMQGFHVIEGDYDPAAWERIVAPIGEALKAYSPAFGAAYATALEEHARVEAPRGRNPEMGGERVANEDAVSEAAGSHGSCTAASSTRENGEEPGYSPTVLPDVSVSSVAELLDDERRKERCRACYRMRLEEAAQAAAQGGFEGLATTLAVSPYQFTDVIREETERAAAQVGIAAHFKDYRPYYAEATRISRELGMYRQNYCGCRFSIREGEATRAFTKQQRARAKAEKAAEREARAAADKARRDAESEEKRAYADERARRRAILKQLRRQN